jgi:short-subunit dehydrogenase involved in D-alanine esterification of teichoic acids
VFFLLPLSGTDGIGRALTQLIAQLNGDVTIVGRTNRDAGNTKIKFVKADLSLMKHAKECGEQLDTDFDTIIFTNGLLEKLRVH